MSRASAQRKDSANVIRLFALSSSVLSSHCTEAVCAALVYKDIKCLESAQHLSLLIGFLLYAIALDPI
uniref:Uncharacterized protein n=1 Tax=Panstrongylus lignarius TaxID=156445 RepID=A0A224XYC2_9HEMI